MAKLVRKEVAGKKFIEGKEEKKTQEVVSSPILTEVTGLTGGVLLPQRKIGMSKQVTVNMGNYNSFKVGIWQERYCEDTEEAANKVLAEMSEEIGELIQAEVDEVRP